MQKGRTRKLKSIQKMFLIYKMNEYPIAIKKRESISSPSGYCIHLRKLNIVQMASGVENYFKSGVHYSTFPSTISSSNIYMNSI